MAINFPDNPPVDFIFTDPVSGGEWQWDGEKWTIVPQPTRDSLVPPVVTGATLTDTGVGDRFTSEVFSVAATVNPVGDPVSTTHARVKFTNPDGVIEAQPESDDIETIGTSTGSDGITVGYTNDNSWADISWAGPPWNCYIAYATSGSSPEKIATSPDGINWTLHSPTGLGSDNNNIIYLPNQQKLASTGYRNIRMCANLDFNFDEDYYVGNQNNDTRGWQFCAYYPDDDSVWTIWTHWNNPAWAKAAAADIPNGSSAWTIRGGPGNYLSHIKVTNGILTCTAGGNHPSSPQAGYISNPTSSSWSNTNCCTQTFQYSGVCYMGVKDTYAYAYNNMVYQGGSGTSIPSTGWVGTDMNTVLDANITGVVINDFVYCEEIGIFAGVGQCTFNGNPTRGIVITTTDGDNWNWIITNDTDQYNWYRAMWNNDRQELVMVASSGTDPGGRLGQSSTLGTTQNFTQLSFVSGAGLAAFSNGMAVTENNGDGTGVIVSLNAPGETMLLKAVTGTWDIGARVQGPATRYGEGFAQLSGDGNVFGVQPEQDYTQMDARNFNVQFPGTFLDGTVPDDALPANTTIEVEYRARSEVNGFIGDSDVTTNQITPT